MTLKRLTSTGKSPLVSHVSESLQGLATIRAYRANNVFQKKLYSAQDGANRPLLLSQLLSVGFTMWISLTTSVLTLFVLLAALLTSSQVPAMIGLALTYMLQLAHVIEQTLLVAADAESSVFFFNLV